MVIDLNKNMKVFGNDYKLLCKVFGFIYFHFQAPTTNRQILLFIVPSVKFQSNDMSCLRNLKQSLINAKCEEVLKKLK